MAIKNPFNSIVREQMSRREFIKALGLAAGAAGATLVLPGCAPQAPAPAAGTPAASLGAGMVDTSAYKKDTPWTIGRSGMGELNSWQVMATFHFDYGVKEKYKDSFGEVFTASATFDPAKQVADLEDLLTHDLDILIVQPVTGGNCVAQIEEAMSRNIPVILPGARAFHQRDWPGLRSLVTCRGQNGYGRVIS
jgi:ribose transport system substrate-binding protein